MRLVTLNIWGGRVYEPLREFIKKQSKSVDIFCFQEVYNTNTNRIFTRDKNEISGQSMWESKLPPRANNFKDLQSILLQFNGFYYSAQDNYDYHGPVNFDLSYGLAIFIKKGIKILEEGEIFVFREKNSVIGLDSRTLGRNLQYLRFKHNKKNFTVANFHGLWNGWGKTDSKDRLEQSRKVRKFLEKTEEGKILCGDFNLLPNTESLSILGKGMRNLIKEFNITSTRSEHYEKPNKFADYVLVSSDIKVKNFKALRELVSDHLPLMLGFE